MKELIRQHLKDKQFHWQKHFAEDSISCVEYEQFYMIVYDDIIYWNIYFTTPIIVNLCDKIKCVFSLIHPYFFWIRNEDHFLSTVEDFNW